MANCIFCQIIAGNVPSKKLFEDDKVLAILDIYPASPGHILLIPKEHYMFMNEIPTDVFAHMGAISQRLSHILVANLKAAGTTVIVQSGQDAGQKAPHFIMHIIPRFENDGLALEVPTNKIEQSDIDDLYGRLKPILSQTFPGQKLEDAEESEDEEPEPENTDDSEQEEPDEILDQIEDLI
ncbi:HIT domain-containing protein [Candidatus Woesearchaeota archaeon]|nr:HIT domain-containing protein [Candidatus Woesearchaeota archaeon]